MITTNDGLDLVMASLMGDGDSPFSSATGNVQLSKSQFDSKTMEGWTAASFDGYAQKVAGSWENGVDVASGVRTLTLTPPTGGTRWVAGANQTTDETIYGIRYVEPANGAVVCSLQLDPPVTISGPGQQIVFGALQVPLNQNALDS